MAPTVPLENVSFEQTMPATVASYAVGGVLGAIGVIALLLNTTVLLAMIKGKLFSKKASPVYLLSSQTVIVDTLMVLAHLGYQCPSIMFQSDLLPDSIRPRTMVVLNALFMYCWYHNSLSHILIAVNRLFVIVLSGLRVFTRNRTIALCILQHAIAASLSITAQFLSPCCEFTYSWELFSYTYNTKPGLENYSNRFIDVPLNTSSTVISVVSYTAIITKMHFARLQGASSEMEKENATLLIKEFKYAIQFATMATAYSLAWIFFRIFPILIGNTPNLFIYGYAEINMLTNATVYLVNNAEIKKSVRVLLKGNAVQDITLSRFEPTTSNATFITAQVTHT